MIAVVPHLASLAALAGLVAQAARPGARVDEVSIALADGQFQLAGTLLRPGGAGPFPAVLFVNGGSPMDRDEMAFGKKPFRALAEALVDEGFATLRLDDRGVGGSGGSKLSCSLEDLAGDVSSYLAWLRSQDGIDPRRIALLGHSQGCYLAAHVAARERDVSAVVLLGGPGLPVDEILARQLALDGHGSLEDNLAMVALAREVVGTGPDAVTELRESWDFHLDTLPAPARAAALEFRSRAEPQLSAFFSMPMLRQTLSHDPRPDLAALSCPALLVVGEHDSPMLFALPEALRSLAGREGADVTVRILPGVNHMLLAHSDPDPRTWATADHDLSPSVSACVRAWLRER